MANVLIILFFFLQSSVGAHDFSDDNLLYVSCHGKQTQIIREKLIERAKSIILFSANYAGGELFQKTLLAMKERLSQEQNLIIFLILSPDMLDKEDEKLLKNLKKSFPQHFYYLITFFSMTIPTKENHAKIFIADDVAIVGGSGLQKNICTEGLPSSSVEPGKFCIVERFCRQFRDMDVLIQGKAVFEIKNFFYKLFSKWSLDQDYYLTLFDSVQNLSINKIDVRDFLDQSKIFNNVQIKLLSDLKYSEEEKNTHEITKTLVSLINKARSSITIAHMNFWPVEEIKNSLENKSKTDPNVDITLISNGSFNNMPWAAKLFVEMNKNNYYLVKNVYEYNVPESLYHKKVWRIDNDITVIGSANCTKKSAFHDDEIAMLIKSEIVAKEFDDILELDKSLSRLVIDKNLNFKEKLFNLIESAIVDNFL